LLCDGPENYPKIMVNADISKDNAKKQSGKDRTFSATSIIHPDILHWDILPNTSCDTKSVFFATLSLSGLGPVTLTVSDRKNQLQPAKTMLTLLEGPACCLRINKQKSCRRLMKYHMCIEDLIVTVTDAFGNIRNLSHIELKVQCIPSSPFVPASMDLLSKPLYLTNGILNLGSLRIGSPPAGTYHIEICSISAALESCTLELQVESDPRYAHDIELLTKLPRLIAGKHWLWQFPFMSDSNRLRYCFVRISLGQEIPALAVRVRNHKGEKFVPILALSESDNSYALQNNNNNNNSSSSSSKVTIDPSMLSVYWNEVQYHSDRFSMEEGCFYFSSLAPVKQAGTYRLKFSVQNIWGEYEISVVAGPPYQLLTCGDPLPSTITSEQVLINSLQVFIADLYGNPVVDCPSYSVKLSVCSKSTCENANDDHNGTKLSLPKLSGTLEHIMEKGVAFFENIRIHQSNETISGIYYAVVEALILSPLPPEEACLPSLKPAFLEFIYKNVEEDSQYRDQLQEQLMKTKNLLRTKRNELETLEQRKLKSAQEYEKSSKHLDQLKANAQMKCSMLFEDYSQVENMSSPRSVNVFLEKLRSDLDKMRSASNRKARYPSHPEVQKMLGTMIQDGTEQSGIIGMIGELGFVENENEAKLYAKFLGAKFCAILLRDQSAFEKYYRIFKDSLSPVYLLSLNSVLPFNVSSHSAAAATATAAMKMNETADSRHMQGSSTRPVSSIEFLPFSPVKGAPVDGFLGFAINRIKFRQDHEYLRHSVFWNLFRDVMVFENLFQAQAYRNYLIKRKIPCPTMFSVNDAETVESTGFVKVGVKSVPVDKVVMFGSLPITEQDSFKSKEALVNSLMKLADSMASFEEMKNSVEMQNLDMQRENLSNEIKKLQETQMQLETEIEEVSTPNVLMDDDHGRDGSRLTTKKKS